VLTRLRSNTSVHSAATASRTRTRQSATKTPSMCAAIRGHVQLFLDTIGLFTILLTDLAKLTLVATAAMNSHDLDAALVLVP
jgi:hypothetical protein